jgi:hypothetical protein
MAGPLLPDHDPLIHFDEPLIHQAKPDRISARRSDLVAPSTPTPTGRSWRPRR